VIPDTRCDDAAQISARSFTCERHECHFARQNVVDLVESQCKTTQRAWGSWTRIATPSLHPLPRERSHTEMSESNIIANQKRILQNQKTILANQGEIKANQQTIKKNQAAILKNQVSLTTIIKNQRAILALLKK
jgi:hypothetical protein